MLGHCLDLQEKERRTRVRERNREWNIEDDRVAIVFILSQYLQEFQRKTRHS